MITVPYKDTYVMVADNYEQDSGGSKYLTVVLQDSDVCCPRDGCNNCPLVEESGCGPEEGAEILDELRLSKENIKQYKKDNPELMI